MREEGLSRYHNLIEAKEKVGKWIKYYNKYRLHSSIQYMPPKVWHFGDPGVKADERRQKLEQAKQERHIENKVVV
ncbi:MAG: integrase core domain-containing protein [Calditrichaceae bacterium]